ncbi:MAG: pyruvate formate-lyase [Oscillospiraceae bacterium]|nr:pyruvate formate-lyase [Oscillospiraceae bacterium]
MDVLVKYLHDFVANKEHKKYRRKIEVDLAEKYRQEGLSAAERTTQRLCFMLENETPVVLARERIAGLRTIENLPGIFTEQDYSEQPGWSWNTGNICPDYATSIKYGLAHQREQCTQQMETANQEQREFLTRVIISIDAVMNFARKYRQEALRVGNKTVADTLERVPQFGAKTLLEALQFFRLLHFSLWCEGNIHICIGRFDQYMYPYWNSDLKSGRLTSEEAFSLLEEFFISFNRDSDLYPGVQKGDNGQSLMLGGVSSKGLPAYNPLSVACLKASAEIMMIDPKINLRVSSDTPIEIYRDATALTQKGLGFPQYSNDDVVIPGLIALGYEPEDARDYTVAACWEFIIPKLGMEVPNIAALCYPKVVNDCTERLMDFDDFYDFFAAVKTGIANQTETLIKNAQDFSLYPAPFMSMLMDDCIQKARDISLGAKYNNYGLHGVGLATAVDAITAIKLYVFDEKTVTARKMMQAVAADFDGEEELLSLLRYNTPKFGDNDDLTNSIAGELTETFAASLTGKRNNRNGIFRAGTGSAMYYMWQGKEMGATAGGHRRGEPLETNYSPALYVQSKGPLSVIEAFTKPDLTKVINGGPLTLELHDSVFFEISGSPFDESIIKVAMLVRNFILSGGHQLQLNAVNRDILLDAQKNPQNHQNLIVRVWGWSAYFVELDKEYQDHVIARQEFRV